MLSSRVILFGPFEADLSSGELRREAHRIRLQAQPFDLLVMLLERPGKVVSRAEIRDKLWPADTFVDFDHSLGTAISKIRAALNDSAEAPRFVETLPKRGYRFIGETLSPPSPVSNSSSEEAPAPSSTPTQIEVMPTPQEWLKPVRSHRLLALSIISLALLASGVFAWRHNSLRASASLPVRSLAVLPLENLSSNPEEEFFANGMTDELITNLAKISSLRVISRSSVLRYRGSRKPVSA